jgi:preprotein translocase subunit SecE
VRVTQLMAKFNPGEFMRQVQAEARKVVWPSRKETTTTAIFVGIMMLILAIFFLGVDSLFGWVVKSLLSLA